MLDTNIKQQLTTYLQNLVQPIELSLATDETAKSRELEQLAHEIAELSDLVSIGEKVDSTRTPLMTVGPVGEPARIEFAGIPMGHEFTSLVLALLHSGGHPAKTEQAIQDQIVALKTELHFETFVSLSCKSCPDVVQALNLMAALNSNIKHTMIDGALFQEETEARDVLAVPAVYVNGEHFSQGRATLKEILTKVDTGASERQVEELSAKDPYDMLIIGGGPAGAAAAVYAARKGIRTSIVAERFGGQLLDTLGVENFISVSETNGPKLADNMVQHVKDYDVEIIENQLVRKLKRAELIELELESGATLKSRSVVLATGARWRELNVPGEQEYRGKGVAYCPHCDGPLFKGKRVAVVGGGNSGVEAAIDLAGLVEHVTVLEFADKLLADEVLQRKARSLPNVDIILNAQTTEVTGDGSRVNGLNYTDRLNGDQNHVELAGIFVQIGLIPNTEFLQGDIDLSERGEILINDRGQTSVPGVYAAGDATTVPFKQIIVATGAGASAALGAFDYLIRTSVPDDVPAENAA
ncbi:MAG: alkyl hydroperoxide reductase subunit F [Gammaproteobacteria bacterium]